MKAIKISANKAGRRYALVRDGDQFGVYAECRNYDGKCFGGIRTSWRYCQRGMAMADAQALFDKKIAGKRRA